MRNRQLQVSFKIRCLGSEDILFLFFPFLWVGFRPVAPHLLTTLSKSEDESMGLGFWWSSIRVGVARRKRVMRGLMTLRVGEGCNSWFFSCWTSL